MTKLTKEYLQGDTEWNVIIANTLIVLVLVAAAVYIQVTYNKEPITYDCGIAEISPDVPLAVKEECRELIKQGMI
jgi:hypothetical protein